MELVLEFYNEFLEPVIFDGGELIELASYKGERPRLGEKFIIDYRTIETKKTFYKNIDLKKYALFIDQFRTREFLVIDVINYDHNMWVTVKLRGNLKLKKSI